VESERVQVDAGKGGVDVAVDAKAEEAVRTEVRRFTAQSSMAVKRPSGESLAAVRDFRIDLKE
jgi:hypothetical protein